MKFKVPARFSSDSLPAIYRDPKRYLTTLPLRLAITAIMVPIFIVAAAIMAVCAVVVIPVAGLFGEITFKE